MNIDIKLCCKYFKELVDESGIIRMADMWWCNISFQGNDFIMDFCPFCGKKIGNHYEF